MQYVRRLAGSPFRVGRSMSAGLRRRMAAMVKRSAFALLRRLEPAEETARAAVATTAQEQIVRPFVAGAAPTSISAPVIINSEQANVTAETLNFHLRGIFSDDRDLAWAQGLFAGGFYSLAFQDVERRLEDELAAAQRASQDEAVYRRTTAFYAHRATSARNRRAYSTAGRVNPNAVFWPDPTDPANGRSLYTEPPFARRFPLIDRTTPVVSAGSCFATEVAHSLQAAGYNYVIKENNKGKPGSYEFLDATDKPNSSAAWGIIFNTPSFRQLVEKAFEVRRLPKILWTQEILGKLRYLDPFRENIAFDSPEAYEENYEEHIRAARDAFLDMEVFVLTLGLNEVWYFKADGSVFSRSPWRTAPGLVGYRTLSVEENVQDLVRMTEILRAHNRKVKIICTLSPIALHATFRGDEQHIVTANAHSKAVLRVAAEEFEKRCRDVHYFPSYEAVTVSTERPWIANQRHVTRDAVTNVMTLFHKMFDK